MTFITFEGGEGAGKSTQAGHLADVLRASGHIVVLTREPGGTPGAEAIRRLMLNPATELVPLADLLLVFAARADHVQRLIRPALQRGEIVICDRFIDSTTAYQGYGLGLDIAIINDMIAKIDLVPDLTLMLDVPDDIAKIRLADRGGRADRYESLGANMLARINAGFRAIAVQSPQRCALIDAGANEPTVFGEILAVLRSRLNLP